MESQSAKYACVSFCVGENNVSRRFDFIYAVCIYAKFSPAIKPNAGARMESHMPNFIIVFMTEHEDSPTKINPREVRCIKITSPKLVPAKREASSVQSEMQIQPDRKKRHRIWCFDKLGQADAPLFAQRVQRCWCARSMQPRIPERLT
jgi:hypothetical protein